MPRSKEIQEQMRKTKWLANQSGKSYKAISKVLGLQWTTVRAIINKWRKLRTVVNLPRSGWPTIITPRAQWRLIQEVIKEPRTTSKELQASLASIKVSVHDSTIRKRQGKNSIHGWVPRQKPLLSKKNTKARLTFANKYLDYPQDFGQIFCGLMKRYIWHKTNTAFHEKNIIPTVKHVDGTVMVWGCFSFSFRTWMTCHNWWNHEFMKSENPEGEWPAVSLWPKAQAHLGYAAGQWSQTHQQVHLWMAQEKQN